MSWDLMDALVWRLKVFWFLHLAAFLSNENNKKSLFDVTGIRSIHYYYWSADVTYESAYSPAVVTARLDKNAKLWILWRQYKDGVNHGALYKALYIVLHEWSSFFNNFWKIFTPRTLFWEILPLILKIFAWFLSFEEYFLWSVWHITNT